MKVCYLAKMFIVIVWGLANFIFVSNANGEYHENGLIVSDDLA